MTEASAVIDSAASFDDWRLYEGVRTRRVMAFCIDYFFIALLTIPAAIIVAIIGFVTFGLAWLAFVFLAPAIALTYFSWTLGGPSQATPGMKLTGIHMERLDHRSIDWVLAIVHTVLFWAGNAILTPLILAATLILDRKRTVHDLLLGTVVVRSGLSAENRQ